MENAPSHCAAREDCVGPSMLEGGVKIGALLGTDGADFYPNHIPQEISDPFTDFDFEQGDD